MTNEELVLKIQQGKRELIPELWDQIEGYIRYLANRLLFKLPPRAGIELDDLINSGYLGFIRALDYFDASRGAFTTVLTLALKTAFAEAAGYRTKKQQQDPLHKASTASLDAPVSDDGETDLTYHDIVPANKDEFIEADERIFQDQLHKALDDIVSMLESEQASILRQRYFESKSPAQISEADGRSIERIRQLERKALNTIRKPKYSGKLRPYQLELVTPYYMKVGPVQYQNTGSSAVEEIAMLRERMRKRMAPA